MLVLCNHRTNSDQIFEAKVFDLFRIEYSIIPSSTVFEIFQIASLSDSIPKTDYLSSLKTNSQSLCVENVTLGETGRPLELRSAEPA